MTGHLAGIPSDDSAKKGCIYADDPMGHYPREGDSDSDALRVMRTKRIAAETRVFKLQVSGSKRPPYSHQYAACTSNVGYLVNTSRLSEVKQYTVLAVAGVKECSQ